MRKAIIKDIEDIHDTKDGQHIHLFFDSGEEYVGLFRGVNGEYICLQSLTSKDRIGLPLERLTGLWWECTK